MALPLNVNTRHVHGQFWGRFWGHSGVGFARIFVGAVSLGLFATFVGMVGPALGDELPAKPEATPQSGEGLKEFFRLNEQLPKAICDATVISRAPLLSTMVEEKAGAARPGHPSVRLALPESRLIAFLMDDAETLVADPRLVERTTALKSEVSLTELKKRVSLEVCTALVTPGKLASLIKDKPELLLPVQLEKLAAAGASAVAVLELNDVDHRLGKVQGQWWIGGWIEPFEVVTAQAGGRTYRRLANPVTNEVQSIQVIGKDGVPLGYFYPTRDEPKLDWETLQTQADTAESKKKRVQTYHLLVENEAFQALKRHPKKVEAIRKLQEFYKSLMNAYEIYPDDPRFAAYGKGGAGWDAAAIRKTLDAGFFKSVAEARMAQSGARVAMAYLAPDPRLHAVFREFRDRLKKI
ncbi:MAG: hypothetical protein AB7P04_05605 [Bacteriovoracia bacterium]